MKLNAFVFPKPTCKWTIEDLGDEIIFIPKTKKRKIGLKQLNNWQDNLNSSQINPEIFRNNFDVPLFKTRKSILGKKASPVKKMGLSITIRPKSPPETSQELRNIPDIGLIEEQMNVKLSSYNFSNLMKSKRNRPLYLKNNPNLLQLGCLTPLKNAIPFRDTTAKKNLKFQVVKKTSRSSGLCHIKNGIASPLPLPIQALPFKALGGDIDFEFEEFDDSEAGIRNMSKYNIKIQKKMQETLLRGGATERKRVSRVKLIGDTSATSLQYNIYRSKPLKPGHLLTFRKADNMRLKSQTQLKSLGPKKREEKESNLENLSDSEDMRNSKRYRHGPKVAKMLRPTMMPSRSSNCLKINRAKEAKSAEVDKTRLFRGIRRDRTLGNLGKRRSKTVTNLKTLKSIPCLLLKPRKASNALILYFHANAEDINQAYNLCNYLRENLGVSSQSLSSKIHTQAEVMILIHLFSSSMCQL